MLSSAQREQVAQATVDWRRRYRKLLMDARTPQAFAHPPKNPDDCAFAKLSVNYSADLKTRVEPCIFGGNPDCSQCGCAISIGLHGIQKFKVGGFVPVGTLVQASTAVGAMVNWLRPGIDKPQRWSGNGKAAKAA